jgi:zinc protease
MSVRFLQMLPANTLRLGLCVLIFIYLLFSQAAFAQTILPIKTWATKNGVRVYYVYAPELPIVDVQVAFDAGAARDGANPGLAHLTNLALSAGTQSLNADQIASKFDDVGAIYSEAINKDMAIVSLRSLTNSKFLTPALQTFVAVLSGPTFPEPDVQRLRKQTLNYINQQEESPAAIGLKAFYQSLYGNMPYGHPILGTVDSVSKLTPQDLQAFYKKYYIAKNALIAIVGDMDLKSSQQLAENIAAHLGAGDAPAEIPQMAELAKSSTQHINYPSTQTHIIIGELGIKTNDPAYYAASVGNFILGGPLTSRLFKEVREKRGLVYGVNSKFSTMRDKGPFMIELQTRNSQVPNAIAVVNDTLSEYIKQGPTEEELNFAKRYLTQGFILHLSSNSAIIAEIVNIGFYDLPIDFLDTYRSKIMAVRHDQVQQLFQQVANPNHLITITVGK